MPTVTMLANGTLELDATSEALQKLSVSDSLDTEDEDCSVFGVLLSEESRTAVSNKCNRLVLGSIVVGENSVRRQHCDQVRQILHASFPTLNGNFVFLSRDGWPILRNQESSVRACQVINDRNAIEIQRNFDNDKCRLAVCTQTQQVLGFIFCDLNATLTQVREAVTEQLKDVGSLREGYQFVERNAWPVTLSQESQLALCDVWSNDSIFVSFSHRTVGPRLSHISNNSHMSEVSDPVSVTFAPSPVGDEPDHGRHVPARPKPVTSPVKKRNRNTIKNLIWGTGFDKSDRSTGGSSQTDPNTKIKNELGLVAKPILISYVRAEAASHAISLKEALKNQGFSVYLDVHEIRTGNDWQDALNYAVSNCTVFVPLITPQYGMTQWTNREVKLADVLHKFIIPVNFIERWPPECLAIQFASTQYVGWNPNADNDIEPTDYRNWKPEYIVEVAEEICKRFKLMFSSKESIQKLRHTVKIKEPKSGTKASTSPYALDNKLGNIMEEEGEQKKNKFVVITAHPKDLIFAEEAKKYLTENGFTVWSSIEWMEDVENDIVFSNMSLSTIPEGKSHSPATKRPLARLTAEVLPEKRGLCRLNSQIVSLGGMTDSLSPEKIERLTTFQKEVDKASVVVVLMSHAYTESSTSVQQTFYCEHRKKIVIVKMDEKPVRQIYSMLMGNNITLNYVDNPQILPTLLSNVKRCFTNQASLTSKAEACEAKMQYLVNFMKKNLPVFSHCVYIAGSTKLQNKRSEDICNAIGSALAKIKDVNIVTGGFFGAGDIVARAFEAAKLLEVPNNYAEHQVVHILPTSDQADYSEKAAQNEEGYFETVSYGKTVFLGDSVKERESAVARLFDICIVIEGGPGAAHEVEEFIWNDHYVIPIISSGGASSGQFGVPLKILETPPAVTESDWSVLSEKEATAEQVAEAVVRIVLSLNKNISEHAKKDAAAKPQAPRKVRRRSRKSRKKRESVLQVVHEEQDDHSKIKPPMEQIEIQQDAEDDYDNESTCAGGPHRWQKFIKIFKPARLLS